MGTLNAILVTVLTSSITTGFLVWLAKAWIESRIKLDHEIKLSTLKAELQERHSRQLAQLTDELRRDTERQLALLKAEQDRISNETNELLKMRLQIFPKLSELIYRIRNNTREIQDDPPRDIGSLEILSTLIKDFEARTYEFRFSLEQAYVFSAVHRYKRLLQTFLLTAKELASWFDDGGDNEEGLRLRREISDLYGKIDRLHEEIIAELVVHAFDRPIAPEELMSSGRDNQRN